MPDAASNLRTWARCCLAAAVLLSAQTVSRSEDWPQWGRRHGRNMASDEKGLPVSFDLGKPAKRGKQAQPPAKLDTSAMRNVKWAVKLGSQTHGTPVIADGRVYAGTNDAGLLDKRLKRTGGGVLMCLDEADGKLLWQLVCPRYEKKKKNLKFNYLKLGVCSTPAVEGDKVYLVSSRAEVLCLDAAGMANGNAGPFKDESKYMVAGTGKPPPELKPADGDIIWRYDLVSRLEVWPEDCASCSVAIFGDYIYICTGNGPDNPYRRNPDRQAPTLIVLDKRTGRLVARDDEKIAMRLFHGQWSSPAVATVGGRTVGIFTVGAKTLIIFGASNGVCYAFEPIRKPPKDGKVAMLKKVWFYDCNPPEYKFRDGKPIKYMAKGDGPSNIIATPVVYRDRVYLAVGQDPTHGRGKGVLNCIDATRTGDISKTGKVWASKDVERTVSTVAIAGALVYAVDYGGRVHCLDADTGRSYWMHDMKAPIWSSPLVADGKVYVGNDKGTFWTLRAGKVKKVLARTRIREKMHSTPVAANGVLYIATMRHLYAIHETGRP